VSGPVPFLTPNLLTSPSSLLVSNGFGYIGIRQPITAAADVVFYMTMTVALSGFSNFAGGSCKLYAATDSFTVTAYDFRTDLSQITLYDSGHITGASTFLLLQLSCSLDSDSTTGTVTIVADDITLYTYPSAIGPNPITPDPVVPNAAYNFAQPGTQFISIRQLKRYVRYNATGNLQVTLPDASTTCSVTMTFSNSAGNQQFFTQNFAASGTVALNVQGQLEQATAEFRIQLACSTTGGAAGSGTLAVSGFNLRIDA
jgi:hypothetical protein